MVSLGADIAGTLPFLRAQAESRFTETLRAYTTTQVFDEETGLYTPAEVVLYSSVPGRVKYPQTAVSEKDQGAQIPAVQDVQIHVRVGATPNVVVNVMWRVTASSADASLVGRVFRTKGEAPAGQVTAARYPVERVT